MKKGYVFDMGSFSFRKAGVNVVKIVLGALKYVAATLSLTVVAYILFSLVVSTDLERRLRRENRTYAAAFPEMTRKEQLLGDVIAGLQLKDNAVYGQVFHTEAPNVDPISTLDFLFASDTIPVSKLDRYASDKASVLEKKTDKVEANFRRILMTVSREGYVMPPMSLPLKDISYPQVGASRGDKMNPFYKAYVPHNGIDLIAPQGASVYAAAAGEVVEVARSTKGQGNVVHLVHAGGYETVYAHLSQISVAKGQKVGKGVRIGSVGMTGSAFAPHLHYEVRRDSLILNPIGYIFASVDPDEYANMYFMSINTIQSMD